MLYHAVLREKARMPRSEERVPNLKVGDEMAKERLLHLGNLLFTRRRGTYGDENLRESTGKGSKAIR